MGQAIHPNDIFFFTQVAAAMRMVAKRYKLQPGPIVHTENPRFNRALGYCHWNGKIEITVRVKEYGKWTDAPMSPEEVWRTAAHELAHLRHMNHGPEFLEFEEELYRALTNDRQDQSVENKIISKLHKLQRAKDGEIAAGNDEAAQAFAAMINKMLIDHELSPSTLADASANDPIIEIHRELDSYGIKGKSRVAWQETMARLVANANLCKFLISTKSNQIWFVGTRSHATVAEYTYGTLIPTVELMSEKAAYYFKLRMNREKTPGKTKGYREGWITGFIDRLQERFEEARKSSISEAVASGHTDQSTALAVIHNKMVRVERYIDDKFRGKSGAKPLRNYESYHGAGNADGRAAADRLNIGKKGISSTTPKGLL